MSGRGKGGKGLGKGGAKRHRKVLRDNIQGESPQLLGVGLLSNKELVCWSLLCCAVQTSPVACRYH